MIDTTNSGIQDRIESVKLALLAMQRHSWEQGVAAQAMLELGETDSVVCLARASVMRQEEGRFAVIGGYKPITDSASVGEAVLFAGKHTGDPLLQTAAEEMIEVMLNTDHRAADGTIYHTQEPAKRIMSDAFYMAPPFLAAAGKYREAVAQIDGFRSYLWDKKSGLYSHIWDDEKKTFQRKAFWGVGNGWTAAGLARVAAHLPAAMAADRAKLEGYALNLIDSCISHLRDDGLFHNIIDDTDSFPEINLSQMIAYSIYRGVARGWADESYLTYADRMRNAAHERVDRYGLVQEVCGVPDFNRSHVAPEGNAFFLLMEAAYRDLALQA